jgi:hypothetical protein
MELWHQLLLPISKKLYQDVGMPLVITSSYFLTQERPQMLSKSHHFSGVNPGLPDLAQTGH